MKNFIFALCGFLMMALMPLNVQASSISELSQCEYVAPSVDVGQPDIQYVTFEIAPVNYFALTALQPVLMIADSPAMQSVVTANMATQGNILYSLSVRSGTSISRNIVRIIVTPHTVN